ncbi:MAG: hypothetical protein ACR2PO_05550, partial [Methyloligellaceae bacterium]
MKTFFVVVVAVIGAWMIAPVSGASAQGSSCRGKDLESRMECKVIALLNSYRASSDRRKLTPARQCHQMA